MTSSEPITGPSAAVAPSLKFPQIETVCFIGAGTMGCVNSLVAAVSGYQAIVYDRDAAALAAVADRQVDFAAYMVATGYCDQVAIEAGRERIRTTLDPEEAAAGADLVSESVVERIEVKHEVHALFDELCAPEAILTTNTSSMLVSEIETAVGRRDRFAALHSHLGSPLWDIVGGTQTAPDTIETLRGYVVSLGGTPLVLRKEHRGYVVNALIGSLTMAALQLLVSRSGSVESIDRGWMTDRRAPIGPFGLLDLFGIDVVIDNMNNDTGDSNQRGRRREVMPLLEEMAAEGRLGSKTGSGFYDYPDPAFQLPGFIDPALALPPSQRWLGAAVACRAAVLAANGIAAPDDIDDAWMAAMGLDAGPFSMFEGMTEDDAMGLVNDQASAGLLSAGDFFYAVALLRRWFISAPELCASPSAW